MSYNKMKKKCKINHWRVFHHDPDNLGLCKLRVIIMNGKKFSEEEVKCREEGCPIMEIVNAS